jgi:hypothetical protein
MFESLKNLMFDPSYATFWTAVGAAAQASAAVMAAAAVLYSITTFSRSLRISHYTEVDRLYFELLKLRFGRPHVLQPALAKSPEQQVDYDTYAFMVWNFLETIYDRCESDHTLWDTWHPILLEEAKAHHTWFLDPKNQGKFKRGFNSYVRRNILSAECAQTEPKARADMLVAIEP